jgi:hypothetical protein
MKHLESELEVHKQKCDQLKTAYMESLGHLKEFKRMLKDVETKAGGLLDEENKKWTVMHEDLQKLAAAEREENGKTIINMNKILKALSEKYASKKRALGEELGNTTLELIARIDG